VEFTKHRSVAPMDTGREGWEIINRGKDGDGIDALAIAGPHMAAVCKSE
jgi:hypothetical protein